MKKKICFILFASIVLMTTLFVSAASAELYCLNDGPHFLGAYPCAYDDFCISKFYKRTTIVCVGEEAPGVYGTHLCYIFHTTCGLVHQNTCPYPDW